jgi:Transposase IS116/IS110/IS902 family
VGIAPTEDRRLFTAHHLTLPPVRRFGGQGSALEQAQRELLRSAPRVGEVVSEVVLAELGDGDRFPSLKDATAYAGLVPAKWPSIAPRTAVISRKEKHPDRSWVLAWLRQRFDFILVDAPPVPPSSKGQGSSRKRAIVGRALLFSSPLP